MKAEIRGDIDFCCWSDSGGIGGLRRRRGGLGSEFGGS